MISEWALEVVPDWTERSACIGMWSIFDQQSNTDATEICWKDCPVRSECLASAIKSERKDTRVFGRLAAYGTRGGYTNVERLVIHKAVADHGFDILETL